MITLFSENRRLKPCIGLILLSFGRISSVLTSMRVWAKVATMAQVMVTSVIGSTLRTRTPSPCFTSSRTMSSRTRDPSTAHMDKQKRIKPDNCAPMVPESSQKAAKEPSSVTTATASWLRKTLPFFRSSLRFFGVAFSVLELSATAHPPFWRLPL